MKKCIAGMIAIGTLASVIAIAAEPQNRLKRDEFAFNLPDLEGKQISSDDDQFKDKVVLVDIWGTWCINCRRAIPSLIELQKKYKEQGLVVVGINFEHETDLAKRRERGLEGIERLGIDYLILDGGNTDDLFKSLPDLEEIEDIPTVILSGRDKKIRFVKTGFKAGDEKVYEAEIQAALADELSAEDPRQDRSGAGSENR